VTCSTHHLNVPIHHAVEVLVFGAQRYGVAGNQTLCLQVPRKFVEHRFLEETKNADGGKKFVEVVVECCGTRVVVGIGDGGVEQVPIRRR
jgi:hypothetical protein